MDFDAKVLVLFVKTPIIIIYFLKIGCLCF